MLTIVCGRVYVCVCVCVWHLAVTLHASVRPCGFSNILASAVAVAVIALTITTQATQRLDSVHAFYTLYF